MALKDNATDANRLDTQPSLAGIPPLDPTINVQNLLLAAVKRIDDLTALSNEQQKQLREVDYRLSAASQSRIDDLRAAETRRVNDILALEREHAREMSLKEEGRLDSIRQVDVQNQAAQAKSALDAIQALAQVTTVNADNIRNQLNATAQQNAKQTTDLATSIANQTAASNDATNQRLAALEKAASEGVGKERVADPAIAAMAASVAALVAAQNSTAGRAAVTDPVMSQMLADIKVLLLANSNTAGHTAQAVTGNQNNQWIIGVAILAAGFVVAVVQMLINGGVIK